MAGEWIKIRHTLDDDPHVLQLQVSLGNPDIDLVIGKLRRLWKYADRHSVDGFLSRIQRDTLDRIVALDGFACALEQVGWIEFTPEGTIIPRFHEHNGKSAKARASSTLRQQKWRAKRVTPKRDKNVTGALPEKRREEKNKEEKNKEENTPLTPQGELANPDFISAWSDWMQFRAELKKKLTPSSIKGQLKKLGGMGSRRAIESIRQSIERGWTGLFEPSDQRMANVNGNHSGRNVGSNHRISTDERKAAIVAAKTIEIGGVASESNSEPETHPGANGAVCGPHRSTTPEDDSLYGPG